MYNDHTQKSLILRFLLLGLCCGLLIIFVIASIFRWDFSAIWGRSSSGDNTSSYESSESVLGTEWPGLVYEEVTSGTFSAKVLKSAKDEIVLLCDPTEKSEAMQSLTDNIDMMLDEQLKVFYLRSPEDYKFWGSLPKAIIDHTQYHDPVTEAPLLAYFSKGKLLGFHRLLTTEDDISYWIYHTRPKAPTPIPTAGQPTPTPTMGPTLYRAFPRSLFDTLNAKSSDEYYLSELILMPRSVSLLNTIMSGSKSVMNIQDNTALYSLIADTFGGTSQTFGLPDLQDELPIDGLNYFLCEKGLFPTRGDEVMATVTSGDIKYVPAPIDWISDDFYAGSIILAKNIKPDDFRMRYLQPCDGRLLNAKEEFVLYSIFGNRFGGVKDQSFRLPDLNSGDIPIEGALYYIITYGIYPVSN